MTGPRSTFRLFNWNSLRQRPSLFILKKQNKIKSQTFENVWSLTKIIEWPSPTLKVPIPIICSNHMFKVLIPIVVLLLRCYIIPSSNQPFELPITEYVWEVHMCGAHINTLLFMVSQWLRIKPYMKKQNPNSQSTPFYSTLATLPTGTKLKPRFCACSNTYQCLGECSTLHGCLCAQPTTPCKAYCPRAEEGPHGSWTYRGARKLCLEC